jgi:maltose O-acetyltransferase
MNTSQNTEKQKMLAGELYLASDPELTLEHQQACRVLRLYNETIEGEVELREQLLHDLFGQIGVSPKITPPFYCDYGSNINAGDHLYLNYGCVILDCNAVYLGDNLLCGPYVQIYTAHHPIDPQIRQTKQELAAPVKIGSNVWIGGGAIICPGVTIGENTTIGAGSVVTHDVPANVVAVGNPCRIIRELT